MSQVLGAFGLMDFTKLRPVFRECLLSFGTESFVSQVAVQKLKDQDIQNYNFTRGFVWV
jgi:hypothetical protein